MALQRGTKLGPYQIEAPLGAGGMGEVYKATDTRLERPFALRYSGDRVAARPYAVTAYIGVGGMVWVPAENSPLTYAKEGTMRSVLVAGHGALAVALVLAACGGGSSGSPTVPTSNVSMILTISILGERGSQSFSPNPASSGGQTVMWRNDNGVTHRIVANDGSFDTGDIVAGATSRMVQAPPGGLNYHCSIHPTTMFGAISGASGGAPPPCTAYCD